MRALLVVTLVLVACGGAQREGSGLRRLANNTASVERGADVVWTTFDAKQAASTAASLGRWGGTSPAELEPALARLDAALDGYAARLAARWRALVDEGAHAEAAAYAAVWRNISRAPETTLERALTADPITQFLASYTLEHVPPVLVHRDGKTYWDLGPFANGARVTAGDHAAFAAFLGRVGITAYTLEVGAVREVVTVTTRTVVEQPESIEKLQAQVLELQARAWRCSAARTSLVTQDRTQQEYVPVDRQTGLGGGRALVTRRTSSWVTTPESCSYDPEIGARARALQSKLDALRADPPGPRTYQVEDRKVSEDLEVAFRGPGVRVERTLTRAEHHRQTVWEALDEVLRDTYRELMPRAIRRDPWAAFSVRAAARAEGDFNDRVLEPLPDYRHPRARPAALPR